MNKKKIYRGVEITLAVIICALMIVCGFVLSKYVHQETHGGTINLTAKLGEITVKEHEAETDGRGSYTLDTGTDPVDSNNYSTVLPGLDIPKDPFVTVTNKSSIAAYVYVEVVNGLKDSKITYTLADSWKLLTGVAGQHGGAVYVYTAGDTVPDQITTNIGPIYILKDDTVYVSDKFDRTKDDLSLTFYACMGECSASEKPDLTEAAGEVYDKLITP